MKENTSKTVRSCRAADRQDTEYTTDHGVMWDKRKRHRLTVLERGCCLQGKIDGVWFGMMLRVSVDQFCGQVGIMSRIISTIRFASSLFSSIHCVMSIEDDW